MTHYTDRSLTHGSRPAHLSRPPAGATLIAWIRTEDVASYRLRGKEFLAIEGKFRYVDHPTQVVVNLCRIRDKVQLHKAMAELALRPQTARWG